MLLLGVDEAGYGPRLGPLCHGLTVWRVADTKCMEALQRPPDLWRLFAPLVTHSPAPAGQIEIDDSKKVFAGPRALARLRQPVALFLAARNAVGATFTDDAVLLAALLGAGDRTRLEHDAWGRPADAAAASCDGRTPLAAEPALDGTAAQLRAQLAAAGVALVTCEARLLTARDFNAHLQNSGNKAEVTWAQVCALLRRGLGLAERSEPVHAVVDRQGGRRFYAAHLTGLLDGQLVHVEQEKKERSAYRGEFRGHVVQFEFMEGAESWSMPVALASMAAKLVRELCMARFNTFFRAQQPGLVPTAGYPEDAARFLRETAALRRSLGIADEALIRER